MYKAYSEEFAHSINGVSGRMFARHVRPDAPHLFSAQRWISEARPIRGYGKDAALRAEIRFDDQCKNGKASFSITGEVRRPAARDCDACGCLHDDIAKVFPELAHLIRWHLFDTSSPMHYVANTCYHASDRDHNGLLKGEERQIINGKTKLPAWKLEAVLDGVPVEVYSLDKYFDGNEADLPPVPELRWVPWCTVGKGKERDFAAARSCAAWPEATDEQLSAPREELEAMLIARLPALMDEMRADMAVAGLDWAPRETVSE